MWWITRWFRDPDVEEDTFDIPSLVATCDGDPDQADAVLKRLERERKRLIRQRKNLQKRMSRFSAARVRDIGRSGPQFGPIQLQAEMRMRDDAGQDANLSLQESDIEERLRVVADAISTVRELSRDVIRAG